MKRLFHPRFNYPKTLVLVLMIFLAYWIFKDPSVILWISGLGEASYFGTFIFGMLFSFGFTAPFAVGYFLTLDPMAIWLHAIIGGFGAMVSDLLIFHLVRFSFMGEFERIEKTRLFVFAEKTLNKSLGARLKNYLMYALAGFVISSPLPDEIGITMLAGLTKINQWAVSILSLIFNTLGILILLMI